MLKKQANDAALQVMWTQYSGVEGGLRLFSILFFDCGYRCLQSDQDYRPRSILKVRRRRVNWGSLYGVYSVEDR